MPVAVSASAARRAPSRLAISTRWLPPALAVIAGMVDLTSFVSLGVFTAHVTGNLVVLAADAVGGGHVRPASALAVPAFMIATAGVWVWLRGAGANRAAPSRSVLTAQFLLLVAVLAVCVSGGATEPRGPTALAAALLAAAAMAIQNGLLHTQIAGSPSTAAMTGNLVSTVVSALDSVFGEPARRTEARARLASVLSLLVGFLLGCLAAAALLLVGRQWAWALPAALAGVVAIAPWKSES